MLQAKYKISYAYKGKKLEKATPITTAILESTTMD